MEDVEDRKLFGYEYSSGRSEIGFLSGWKRYRVVFSTGEVGKMDALAVGGHSCPDCVDKIREWCVPGTTKKEDR